MEPVPREEAVMVSSPDRRRATVCYALAFFSGTAALVY
jgi:hypothetical protein